MWQVALIQAYGEQHTNVAHYPYAYAALFALDEWDKEWNPDKVVLTREGESMTMTVEEFREWCLQENTETDKDMMIS